jgi:AcrR family transcriptional regulator
MLNALSVAGPVPHAGVVTCLSGSAFGRGRKLTEMLGEELDHMASRPTGRLISKGSNRSNAHRASGTRRRILEASCRLFSTRGFADTTVRDIAREARVTDAAIYYHFRTKRDVLHELVNGELSVDSAFRQLRADEAPSLPELVGRILDCSLRLVETNGDLLRIVLREGLAGEPAATKRYREVMDSWERHVAEAIRQSGVMTPQASVPAETLAREMVYTVAMGIEDALLFGRDGWASPHSRGLALRRFLVRELATSLPAAHAPAR